MVLDEPTSALDPTARAEIIELLQRIQQDRGTSYLFISHDLSTVRFISHRVAVMYLGMIVEQGDAAAVFSQPRHPYSVGLLSSVLLPNPNITVAASVSLKGEIPSPINLPRGCYLASRCPFVIERCRREMPAASDLGRGHLVHCFRHQDVALLDRQAACVRAVLSRRRSESSASARRHRRFHATPRTRDGTMAGRPGKKALVTGGAQGIGEIALAFASEGADVAVLDLRLDAARRTAAEIAANGVKGMAVAATSSDEPAVQAAVAEAPVGSAGSTSWSTMPGSTPPRRWR